MSEQQTRDQLDGSWRAAQLAEVAWRARSGVPDATAVVPLLDDGVPCLALPYAQLELARALEQAPEIVIGVTNRSVGRDAEPMLAHVNAEVIADPDGLALEQRGLLPQLIAKHPPDRRRLDSLLQRREHWWYVPRLLVRFTDAHAIRSVDARDGLLVVGGERLQVSPCAITSSEPLVLGPDARHDTERPALVLRHGADVPELEQPWQQRWRGVIAPHGFELDSAHGHGPPDRPLTLRQRVTAAWRLERACRRGLKAAGHAD